MEQFVSFDQADRARLNELLSYPTKTFSRGDLIIEEGKKVQNIHLLMTGLAAVENPFGRTTPDHGIPRAR
jgi:hypothetical protein